MLWFDEKIYLGFFLPVMSSNFRKAGNCNIFKFGLDTFGSIMLLVVLLSTVFDVFSAKFVFILLIVTSFSNFRSLLLYFVKALLLLLSSEPAKNATSKLRFEPAAKCAKTWKNNLFLAGKYSLGSESSDVN